MCIIYVSSFYIYTYVYIYICSYIVFIVGNVSGTDEKTEDLNIFQDDIAE